MPEEGFIKFNCHWIKTDPVNSDLTTDLINWRNKLYQFGLIGCYENGVGYGNISVRHKRNSFLITGSGTGKYACLENRHITLVTEYNLDKNQLTCKGPVKASSESLTHAVIYQHLSNINAVVHIHNLDLWNRYLNKLPTTSKHVEYGTPQMAKEVIKLLDEPETKSLKICIMGGHLEGIITFGKNLEEACNIVLKYYEGE